MLTEAQLKERATYIGSSDAKVIASGDIDEWQTLAAQKRGEETWRPSKQVQLMMDAGSHMESFILKKWEEQEAANVCMVGAGKTTLIGTIPLHSTFDACITGSLIPVEIKTHFGFKDMDELCELYAPQCQHHMLVANNNLCYLVALFGVRCRLEWRLIKADHAWQDDYVEQCKKFWDMYQNRTEQTPLALPPVEYSDMFVMNMRDLPDWSEEVDSSMRILSASIIEAKEAVSFSDQAKNAFKSRMPEKCRRMDYDIGGNLKGHKIRVTRSRAGTLTCTHIAPKEKNDE
ncbi:MAG: hypothetical protein CL833_11990 [Crocinitomicaceae bacterium]|nr:hypothetical protein [Crocinitomicaceae bacterium]|tara:strand:+ start:426 stop:1289 length:864 start_codon:yes stop_codon:yes gene_type:complete